jgi:hypothetical protein
MGASPASAPITATIPASNTTLAVTVGTGAAKAVQFATNAGTIVLIKFSGHGTATVNFAATTISQANGKSGVIVSGTDISIASIIAAGSGVNSVLTITTKGGDKTVSVGNISTDGSVNSINAATTTLVGTLAVAGSANRIALGSASSATITVGGGLAMLAVPSVSDLTLTAGGVIRNIKANTWSSSQPITAPSIGSINIKGAAQLNVVAAALRALHVGGSLNNATFSLSGVGISDLATLTAGAISGTIIDSAGNIGSISTSALDNSQIYAGAGASGAVAFPPVSSAFPAAAVIANINLRKIRGAISMVNSSIAAFKINSLSLGVVQFNNSGKAFGVEAANIAALRATDSSSGRSFAFTRLTSAAIVAGDLAAKGISPRDFMIEIV